MPKRQNNSRWKEQAQELRRERAEKVNEARKTRSDEDQIRRLDEGGYVAKKERERLAAKKK